ncbi:unnamed protein product, partial [Didymodactylos carnosus]
GFTTGAAVHVFSSQLPALFGLKSPKVQGAWKIPKFYIKIFKTLPNVNFMSITIAFTSIILLYTAKQLNEKYKKKIRVIVPCELLLIII